ncbi:nucleoside deaminase [Clostridium fungisolvens]|uniref:tRNA-specific adenosine deaminase n=1 Tax=Clostridium fungisolvens TaxID=1604897 RepID=A0A6V8SIL3_9CLOT|nr:nucleoside deaminase [Clostridium fungisolvens]GFP76800.1 tRNA-specific adenosine deaminase [Clostridium fungisolvens]
MWKDLNYAWQEAFALAWESFKKNTIPIGAVIVDESGKIISKGRNRIFDTSSNNPLAGTGMAHAETTAMLTLKREEHLNIKKYTLYTTMEPCPMCFGAMVMVGIRNIKYAARDGYAGATELNDKMEYIKSKNMNFSRENEELEAFQICLQSAYEYKTQHSVPQAVLDSWSEYCSNGVLLAKELDEDEYFQNALSVCKPIGEIYDEVINRLHKGEGFEKII